MLFSFEPQVLKASFGAVAECEYYYYYYYYYYYCRLLVQEMVSPNEMNKAIGKLVGIFFLLLLRLNDSTTPPLLLMVVMVVVVMVMVVFGCCSAHLLCIWCSGCKKGPPR